LLEGPIESLASLYSRSASPVGLSLEETLLLLGGGAALGWAGAWLAAARHLRAIEPT
jgi:cell division transport system permease protein